SSQTDAIPRFRERQTGSVSHDLHSSRISHGGHSSPNFGADCKYPSSSGCDVLLPAPHAADCLRRATARSLLAGSPSAPFSALPPARGHFFEWWCFYCLPARLSGGAPLSLAGGTAILCLLKQYGAVRALHGNADVDADASRDAHFLRVSARAGAICPTTSGG